LQRISKTGKQRAFLTTDPLQNLNLTYRVLVTGVGSAGVSPVLYVVLDFQETVGETALPKDRIPQRPW